MAKIPGVLIVDQDPDSRFQVQRLVQQTTFAVAGQVGLGTEAVAQATDTRPDIILCGIKEPVARVVQTIESLVHALPETPIIAYASSSELATIRKAMLAGARDFLQAPFKPDELKHSLTSALESEERRHLRQAGSAMIGSHGAIITVFGAKGGVGKTTIATNLGVALAQRAGQDIVLVDADDTFGDSAVALSLTTEHTVTDAVREQDGDELKKNLTYHESGLAVLPAPANPFHWKGIPGERVEQMLQQLARQFDVVLVDTGSTLSEVSLAALNAASLVLWVTTPDYASIRDSLQALEAIRTLSFPEDRIRFVLNVAFPTEIEARPSSIEEALDCKIFWTVPYDRQLRRSAQLGRMLVETDVRSPAAASITDLAAVLSGGGVLQEPQDSGLLQRIFAGTNISFLRRDRSKVKERAGS